MLGHAIRGVHGIYNRHAYFEEKGDALLRLAGLVESIVNPPAGDNVLAAAGRFRRGARAAGKKRARAQQSEGAASLR